MSSYGTGPGGAWQPGIEFRNEPVSGTRHNGVWEQWMPTPPGTVEVDMIELSDTLNNFRVYRAPALQAMGLPTSFTVPPG